MATAMKGKAKPQAKPKAKATARDRLQGTAKAPPDTPRRSDRLADAEDRAVEGRKKFWGKFRVEDGAWREVQAAAEQPGLPSQPRLPVTPSIDVHSSDHDTSPLAAPKKTRPAREPLPDGGPPAKKPRKGEKPPPDTPTTTAPSSACASLPPTTPTPSLPTTPRDPYDDIFGPDINALLGDVFKPSVGDGELDTAMASTLTEAMLQEKASPSTEEAPKTAGDENAALKKVCIMGTRFETFDRNRP